MAEAKKGTLAVEQIFLMARRWVELERRIEVLEHNNRVLTDALWKACGDDVEQVKATIESQGSLK